MLFNSVTFVIFVCATFILYYLPLFRRHQVLTLVGCSFIFYAWNFPILLLLLVSSIAINALSSYRVAYGPANRRLLWATLGVVSNLAILSFFKYGRLLAQTFHLPMHGAAISIASIPLPIGISFYTFEGISLLVDVLRTSRLSNFNDPATNALALPTSFAEHFSKTALFIAFFPHLASGPILKARNFYPQINQKHLKDIPWFMVFRILTLGYFLKMVVADNLKDYTFWIDYPYFLSHNTVTLIVLLFGFSMQIFADFAGYSLIAIGIAQLFGYLLPDNFNFPYISRSLTEFWRRWHISLSTWLRDYLYFPLGGNRKGRARTYLNLMIVMFLGGLWHGAAWSFAVWGAYHGAGLMGERMLRSALRRPENPDGPWKSGLSGTLKELLKATLVFGFVTLGWLLFKLTNFHQAVEYVRAIPLNRHIPINPMLILPVLIYSIPVLLYHWRYVVKHKLHWASRLQMVQDRVLASPIPYAVMLALIIVNSGSSNAFIYFQF